MTKEKTQKKHFSIRWQVMSLILFVVLFTIGVSIWNAVPSMKRSILALSEDYMQDLCSNKRDLIQEREKDLGKSGLTPEYLKELFENTTIQDMESGYLYLVDRDGTMLYHPTADKIGKSVENSVILGVVKDVADGKQPQDNMTTYMYNGKEKYAVYCLTDQQLITVFTVDRSEIMHPVNRLFLRSILAGLLILIILLPLGFLLAGNITKPINYLSKVLLAASRLEFKDDKKVDAICKNPSESGEIGKAIRILRVQLQDTIRTIQKDSDQLQEESDGMSRSVERTRNSLQQVNLAVDEIAQGAQHQAEDTTNANSEVAEIGSEIEAVKKEVDDVTQKSQEMLLASENAMGILNQLKQINKDVMDKVKLVEEQTNETNQSVQKIQEATNIITEIASRTNLLALNASIEAARAGEAGKGFAVVSEEIKQLAEQSNASAEEIQVIVTNLISDSKKVVTAMNSVHLIMQEQSIKVANTDETFHFVKTYIDESSHHIAAIDAKTNDMNERRARIVDKVTGLSAIAQENAASTQETAAAIQEVSATVEQINRDASLLAQQAKEMKEKLAHFQF